ncbi:MAG: hypothetical protein RRB13_08040 [bacterium]|nr:hypothetical protein [bacterium]
MARLLILSLFIFWTVPSWAVSLADRVGVVEQRMVDLERVQNDQAKDAKEFRADAKARLDQLQAANKGFFSELDALREDLKAIAAEGERDQQGNRQLKEQLAQLEAKLDAQAVELFELKELIQAQAAEVALGNQTEAFDEAMKVFKAGNWPKAQDQMLAISKAAKDPELAKESLYYGSFAAHVAKDWKTANAGFSDLIRQYPKSNRVPVSRWRLALGLIEAGDPKAAKKQLKSLIADKSKENAKLAAKAAAKLKQLR